MIQQEGIPEEAIPADTIPEEAIPDHAVPKEAIQDDAPNSKPLVERDERYNVSCLGGPTIPRRRLNPFATR